jgi:hypothetical protein
MARRSETVDDLVEAIGLTATQALIKGYGGKQVVVPDGSGRAGAFSAWLDEFLGITAAGALRHTFGGERLTVPIGYAQALDARNRAIVGDYDGGMGILDLIQKYRLTERQLRTILNRPLDDEAAQRAAVDDKQLGLF